MELEKVWFQISEKYCSDNKLIELVYEEILRNYSEKERHYHGISHLKALFFLLEEYKEKISDFDLVAFSIFYHDVIYKAWKKDNEEQSAIFAEKELTKLNIPTEKINKIKDLILATKTHDLVSSNFDDNFFLDIDLAILGTDPETYKSYTEKVRDEYSFVPYFMYKSGRRKVLQEFVKKENLYKTELMKERFENQARKNLAEEIEFLK